MHREILNSAQNKLLKLLPSFIDIVVEFESDKKNIHNFLAEREVDLGIESNLKPLIKEKVKSQIIYASRRYFRFD